MKWKAKQRGPSTRHCREALEHLTPLVWHHDIWHMKVALHFCVGDVKKKKPSWGKPPHARPSRAGPLCIRIRHSGRTNVHFPWIHVPSAASWRMSICRAHRLSLSSHENKPTVSVSLFSPPLPPHSCGFLGPGEVSGVFPRRADDGGSRYDVEESGWLRSFFLFFFLFLALQGLQMQHSMQGEAKRRSGDVTSTTILTPTRIPTTWQTHRWLELFRHKQLLFNKPKHINNICNKK